MLVKVPVCVSGYVACVYACMLEGILELVVDIVGSDVDNCGG